MGIVARLQTEFDYEIVDDFIDHFDIITFSLESLISSLRNNTNPHDKIEELFRIFHNLKSASGFLKLTMINKVATLVEDELTLLRELKGGVSSEVIDWLYIISDQISRWNDDLANDRELSKVDKRVIRLPKKLELN